MKFKTNIEGIRIAQYTREDFKNFPKDHQVPNPLVYLHKEDILAELGLDKNNDHDWEKFYDLLMETTTEIEELTENYKHRMNPYTLISQMASSPEYEKEVREYYATHNIERISQLPARLRFGEYISEVILYMMLMLIDTEKGKMFRTYYAFMHIPNYYIWTLEGEKE